MNVVAVRLLCLSLSSLSSTGNAFTITTMAPTLRSRSNLVALPAKRQRKTIPPSTTSSDVDIPDESVSTNVIKPLLVTESTSPVPISPISLSSTDTETKTTSSAKATAVQRPKIPQFTSLQIASICPENEFVDLKVPKQELRPSATLTTGQCFHWTAISNGDLSSSSIDNDKPAVSAWGTHNATEWLGTLRDTETGESVVLVMRESEESCSYRILYAPETVNVDKMLRDYFQLDVCLSNLYKEWSTQCPRLAEIAKVIPGVRVLQQDPWECLVSFLCSSNNNIPRITQMLYHIRRTYGQPLICLDDATIYSFPSLQELVKQATEDELRQVCGMGYRAKYLLHTAELLQSLGGEPYLLNLRKIQDPTQVQECLLQFKGVGRKVADCVALFSLQQTNAIPVDVHVWNIARRDYDPKNKLSTVKSITPTVYAQVGELFRSRFLSFAGWAHSLLFVAELPSFRSVLPPKVVEGMKKAR